MVAITPAAGTNNDQNDCLDGYVIIGVSPQ
jgi:hypothetical protein